MCDFWKSDRHTLNGGPSLPYSTTNHIVGWCQWKECRPRGPNQTPSASSWIGPLEYVSTREDSGQSVDRLPVRPHLAWQVFVAWQAISIRTNHGRSLSSIFLEDGRVCVHSCLGTHYAIHWRLTRSGLTLRNPAHHCYQVNPLPPIVHLAKHVNRAFTYCATEISGNFVSSSSH